MIQIISGVYGHYIGSCVEPKDKNSAPFELEPEKEERLVEQGVAVYVDDCGTSLPEGVEGIPQYDENTSAKELTKIGKTLGLTFKVGTTKVAMIAALDAYIAERAEADGENDEGKNEPPAGEIDARKETPPTFDPAQAVQ